MNTNHKPTNTLTDLVVCGPDMSGTSSQIQDLITYFQELGKQVRDIRGTEIDALYHAKRFESINSNHISLQQYLRDTNVPQHEKDTFLFESYKLLSGYQTNNDLRIASMVQNDLTTYIDPDSADVWVMEEPARRGAGQVNRTLEQNRTAYGTVPDHTAASLAHQAYRADEFFRFRKPLRDAGKIILRSRSEESACYQVYDEKRLPDGISQKEYLSLPGHSVAFSYPPTHLFVVCGPEEWTVEEYQELKEQRSGKRILDDYENNLAYQVMVNNRYAGQWIETLYKEACEKYGSHIPEIIRFDIYKSREELRQEMIINIDEYVNV